MYPHLLKIQLAMLCLVCTSSLLLGRSISDSGMIWITTLGAVTAFLVVDRLKLVELSGWVANVVSILVLLYTMKDFIGAGSAGKLVSVANLLAYLLTVLLFQKKTPRLCWQIMVLSVLQISLAAIFNLNFEGGVLFIAYFAFATFAMILQNDFDQWTRIQTNNRKNAAVAGKQYLANQNPLLVISKQPRSRNVATMLGIVGPWTVISLLFSFILFHSLPHTRQKLNDSTNRKFTGTGKSWKVDLDEDGFVSQSTALVLRAQFFDLETDKKIILNDHPYFRGMAMGKLVLDNGNTSWAAPYDHVFAFSSYFRLPRLADSMPLSADAKKIGLEIILEPTADPLLFGTMPMHLKPDEEYLPEFCRDLSALTRRRSKNVSDLTSFRYRLNTIVDANDRPFSYWPYRSFMNRNATHYAMEDDSPEYRMLTEMEPARYPELVRIANEIANQDESRSRTDLCNALLQHFSESNGYSYTIDYRSVGRNKQIDPVEDFVSNHRTGHCAMFASSLTLMLRSLGIPARYVVGYHGGDYNNLTDCYVIHGRNAHAWVEAYIPPGECTEEMVGQGIAGLGGAWLTLDATPPIDFGSSSEALDLARSIWQDYVISPDHNKQTYAGAGALQSASLADSQLGQFFSSVVAFVKSNRLFQFSLLAATLLYISIISFGGRAKQRSGVNESQTGFVRRFIGKAISVVSADIGKWVAGDSETNIDVPFYRRFEKILKRNFALERRPDQTQREFAIEASTILVQHDTPGIAGDQIAELMKMITDSFYQLRFGSIPLDSDTVHVIENQLQNLEQSLKTKPN